MCQRLDALSASKAKLAPEALSQVAALQELQDRAFNEEADEDVQRRGRRRRSTKRPTKTTTATLGFQDSTNRPYGMITSSFQYQLDGLLTRRGFEVNRRSISQLANRDVEKAHRLIGKAHWQRRSRPSLYSAGGVMVRVRWCGCVRAGALVRARWWGRALVRARGRDMNEAGTRLLQPLALREQERGRGRGRGRPHDWHRAIGNCGATRGIAAARRAQRRCTRDHDFLF